jgi:cell division protein FtsB
MKRALVAIAIVVALASLTYWVTTHDNVSRVEHLRSELERLEGENNALAKKNDELEKTILALRDDPRLAERRAREEASLARPGETIYQFESPDEPIAVAVKLEAGKDVVRLAGKDVTIDDLPRALEELKRQVPGATLEVSYDDDVDAIGRQVIQDIVADSPIDAAD